MDWVNIRNNKIPKMNNCACNATCQQRQVYKRKPKGWLRDLFFCCPIVVWMKECYIQTSVLCEFGVRVSIEIGRSQTTLLLVRRVSL